MKSVILGAGLAMLAGTASYAGDFKFTVTNMQPEGMMMAPLIIVDAGRAEAVMFDGDKLSAAFIDTILNGDPRPMNGTMPEAVAGPVLGKSGPPGVMINGGETAETDLYIEASTIRFYAKAGYGPESDTVISGVWDIAMGGGELMLHSYDIGHSEGTNKITVAKENVVKVVITEN